jgi:hypothetical protein
MSKINQALWLATGNIARFRELLESPLDEFQRQQLEGLLTREVDRYNSMLPAPAPSGKSRI